MRIGPQEELTSHDVATHSTINLRYMYITGHTQCDKSRYTQNMSTTDRQGHTKNGVNGTWLLRFSYCKRLLHFTAMYPESPAYGVYTSKLIRYARACSSYGDFIDTGRLLTKKLVDQGYTLAKLKKLSKVLWSIQ